MILAAISIVVLCLSMGFCAFGFGTLKLAKTDLASAKAHWESSQATLVRCNEAIVRNGELLDEVKKIHDDALHLHRLNKAMLATPQEVTHGHH